MVYETSSLFPTFGDEHIYFMKQRSVLCKKNLLKKSNCGTSPKKFHENKTLMVCCLMTTKLPSKPDMQDSLIR